MSKIFDRIKPFLANGIDIEFVVAIKIFEEGDDVDAEFSEWIQINTHREGEADIDFSKIAVFDTPDALFGGDEPEEVFSIDNINGIIRKVKLLLKKKGWLKATGI